MNGRIFAIPDIHGEYHKLENLLFILAYHHNVNLTIDKLVFLGDYVDRGLDSCNVLEYIKELQEEHPSNVIALLGNHEQMMIDYYQGLDKWGLWLCNGGNATIQSLQTAGYEECPDSLLEWLKSLPLCHQERGFFFSHAPIGNEDYRGVSREVFTKEDMIWSYWKGDESLAHKHKDAVGVCGHIHALNKNMFHPRFYDHYIFADAGCGCHPKAPLCAINVETREVVYSV